MLALAAHGCRHIQLDEPVMMRWENQTDLTNTSLLNDKLSKVNQCYQRYPEDALEFGVKNAGLVFAGCPDSVERTVFLSSS